MFRVAFCEFENIFEYIEVELGQTELCGTHELRWRLAPQGRAMWACGALEHPWLDSNAKYTYIYSNLWKEQPCIYFYRLA